MKISKITTLLLFVLLGSIAANAQQVNYKTLTNSPRSAKLSIGISPLDFFFLGGEPMGGPGINAYFRPIEKLKVGMKVSSAMYMNDLRGEESVSSLKRMGGLFSEAHLAYTWLKKGINLTDPSGKVKETKFNLKSSLTFGGSRNTYINYPFNRVIERSIRLGGFYNNIPLQNNTEGATGVFVGLSRTGRRYASIDVDGFGQKARGSSMGYYLDFMFGSVAPVDPNQPVESGSGFRVGFNIESVGGLTPVTTTFELGKMPGASGYMRLMFTFSLQSGEYFYQGSYKEKKAPTKTLPALIRAL